MQTSLILARSRLDNIARLTTIELALADHGLMSVCTTPEKSFVDHLEQARAPSEPSGSGRSDPTQSDRAGQSAPDRPPPPSDQPPGDDARLAPTDGKKSEESRTETHQDRDKQAAADSCPADGQQVDGQQAESPPAAEQPQAPVANDERPADGETEGKAQDSKGPRRIGAKQLAGKNALEQSPPAKPSAAAVDPLPTSAQQEGLVADSGEKPRQEATGQETAEAAGKNAKPAVELATQGLRAAKDQQRAGAPLPQARTPGQPQNPQPQVTLTETTVAAPKGTAHQPSLDVTSANTATTTQVPAQIIANHEVIAMAGQTDSAPETSAAGTPQGGSQGQPDAAARLLPQQASRAEAPSQPGKAAQATQADPARFVERVARAFRAIGSHQGSLRLRLSPPELGSLRLHISVRNGALTARVEAETPAVRNLLLDNLPVLRDRLAQQDIRVQRFDVDLMEQPLGDFTDHPAGQAQSFDYGQPSSTPPPGRETEPQIDAPADSAVVHWPGKGTRLNVVI